MCHANFSLRTNSSTGPGCTLCSLTGGRDTCVFEEIKLAGEDVEAATAGSVWHTALPLPSKHQEHNAR